MNDSELTAAIALVPGTQREQAKLTVVEDEKDEKDEKDWKI